MSKKLEKAKLQEALDILSEHFEAGVILVTNSEGGVTSWDKKSWGNTFTISGLTQFLNEYYKPDFENGNIDTDDDEEWLSL